MADSAVVTSSSFTTTLATVDSTVVTSASFTTGASTQPVITNGPFTVTHNTQITLQGENLDLVTSVTYAGSTVAIDSQTSIELTFTTPDAYTNGLGFNFTHFIVVSNNSAEEDSTQNTLAVPAGTFDSGEVTGYDNIDPDFESWFDDTTISVVDGDYWIAFDPNIISGLILYDDGTYKADETGQFEGRVLDVSNNTDGPDGTWTELRTITISEKHIVEVSENHQTTSVFSARLISRTSVLESISNQDNLSSTEKLLGSVSESLNYQDSVSSIKKIVASVTESLVSEDTSSKRSNLLTDLSDNTSYTDLEQARINLFASLVDAYVAGESWAATAFMIAQQDEVLTTQDLYSATITGINEGLVSEQSQFFDSFLTSAHMLGLVTNTQSIGDVVVAVAKISRFVFENLQTTDQYTTLLGSVGNVNENLTLTEVKQAQTNLLSSLVDGYTAGDLWASTAFLIAQKSESIQTSDSYSADLFLLENNIVSEQTTYLSSFIASAQMLGIVTENQSIADIAIAVATISRNISETLSVGDMYTSVVKVVRQVLETTSYSDSFTAVLTTTTEQLFEDMEFIDLVSGQTQLRAIVSEQIVWSDSYAYPTAIGMIQAVIAIKTYIDATLGIGK